MNLENPAENPCFGCGPRHARGLRLNFRREGADVVTTYVPKDDEVGWPGLFHTSLHHLVLFETRYWAVLDTTGKVHSPEGEQRFAQRRLPRIGQPFVARAVVLRADDGTVATEATSRMHDGRSAGRLACTWRPASRSVAERAGLGLPAYLLDAMGP